LKPADSGQARSRAKILKRFHFPFSILRSSFAIARIVSSLQWRMTNGKWKMENGIGFGGLV
jgi:hypothetical protein